jgi:FAD-dependent urate hydroxylase
MVSLGNLANDIPALSEGAERLARAIAIDLFQEDKAIHWQRLADFADPELLGDEIPGLDAWSPPLR